MFFKKKIGSQILAAVVMSGLLLTFPINAAEEQVFAEKVELENSDPVLMDRVDEIENQENDRSEEELGAEETGLKSTEMNQEALQDKTDSSKKEEEASVEEPAEETTVFENIYWAYNEEVVPDDLQKNGRSYVMVQGGTSFAEGKKEVVYCINAEREAPQPGIRTEEGVERKPIVFYQPRNFTKEDLDAYTKLQDKHFIRERLAKAILAGYPYNNLGIQNELSDYEFRNVTQDAIFYLITLKTEYGQFSDFKNKEKMQSAFKTLVDEGNEVKIPADFNLILYEYKGEEIYNGRTRFQNFLGTEILKQPLEMSPIHPSEEEFHQDLTDDKENEKTEDNEDKNEVKQENKEESGEKQENSKQSSQEDKKTPVLSEEKSSSSRRTRVSSKSPSIESRAETNGNVSQVEKKVAEEIEQKSDGQENRDDSTSEISLEKESKSSLENAQKVISQEREADKSMVSREDKGERLPQTGSSDKTRAIVFALIFIGAILNNRRWKERSK